MGLWRCVHATSGAPLVGALPTTQAWSAPIAPTLIRPTGRLGVLRSSRWRHSRQRQDDRDEDDDGYGDARTATFATASSEVPHRTVHQSRSDADPGSRKSVALSRVRRTEAGHAVDTGPVRAAGQAPPCGPRARWREPCGRPEEGGDGGGERQGRHRVDVGEMALVDLLEPAGRVELDHLHVETVIEVGHGRIVEGQMAVLPDPEAAESRGWLDQELGVAAALGPGVGQPVDVVGRRGGRARFAMRSRIQRWNPAGVVGPGSHVLVHVEDDDVGPGDIRRGVDEGVDEGQLGVPRGEHGVGHAPGRHRAGGAPWRHGRPQPEPVRSSRDERSPATARRFVGVFRPWPHCR